MASIGTGCTVATIVTGFSIAGILPQSLALVPWILAIEFTVMTVVSVPT